MFLHYIWPNNKVCNLFHLWKGDEIVYAVQNVTRDFQIGFGSFVDKEVMPFISMVPQDNCQFDSGDLI